MKGISAIISTVMMVAIAFTLATMISPWLFSLTNDVTNQTTSSVTSQITCQSASVDFDSSYGFGGVVYNITGATDKIETKMVNTGTLNLYGFSMEVEVDSGTDLGVYQYEINTSYQKTAALPLKPGQSAILRANLTNDLNGTLVSVKVLNSVCPGSFVKQTL